MTGKIRLYPTGQCQFIVCSSPFILGRKYCWEGGSRKRFDSVSFFHTYIHCRDCWYLIDTNWLSAWNAFVRGDNEPEPGPISSKDLLDDKGQPLPGLKNSIGIDDLCSRFTIISSIKLPYFSLFLDYRGVSPLVFYIFVELHGKDTNYPDICRYTVDIYKPAVPIERIVNISLRAIVSYVILFVIC